MTAFSQTITNRVSLFGGSPSNKWGSHVWNAFLWGDGTADLETRTQKLISGSVTVTDALHKEFAGYRTLTITLAGDMYGESLRDAAGYYHVFPDRTTEAEDRDFPNWTAGAASAASWVSVTFSAVNWS